MFSRFSLAPRHLCFIAALITCMGLETATTMADDYWDVVKANIVIVVDTSLGNLTAQQEVDMIAANWDAWREQKADAGLIAVGQVGIITNYPVQEYGLADLGNNETLTYFFIDPNSGLPTETTPFEVTSVRYEALLNPQLLTLPTSEIEIRANLTTLGTSFDAVNDFALDFTLKGFEPIILACPLDANGDPINPATGSFDVGTSAFASHVLVDPFLLVGDVNCDGVVNLLDVSPFIELLSSGGFNVKADINVDGVVNLLDVSPFIAILSGG